MRGRDREPSIMRAIRGPITLITVGVLFALNNFTPYSFDKTWPVLLIVFGLLSLMKRSMEPAPPPPPPVQPYPPPAYAYPRSTRRAATRRARMRNRRRPRAGSAPARRRGRPMQVQTPPPPPGDSV